MNQRSLATLGMTLFSASTHCADFNNGVILSAARDLSLIS